MSILTSPWLAAIAVGLAVCTYWFNGTLNMHQNLESGTFWSYASTKAIRDVSTLGEKIGLGSKLELMKKTKEVVNKLKNLVIEEVEDKSNIQIRDEVFDGVPVLILENENRPKDGPALIWIHGGGWVSSNASSNIQFLKELAFHLNILVISIEYRLAPEFTFPAGVDDCLSATKYFLLHANSYNVDPFRVAISGSSAGANLAAAVSIRLRDDSRNGFPVVPKVQILLCPCLQAINFNTPSYHDNEDDAFLPKELMIEFWLLYAAGITGLDRLEDFSANNHVSLNQESTPFVDYADAHLHGLISRDPSFKSYLRPDGSNDIWEEVKGILTNPYFAPLMAHDLSHLPIAFIATAEFDVLRDDGLLYALRLRQAGVSVIKKHYENGFHNLLYNIKTSPTSSKVVNDLLEFLKVHL